MSYVTAVTDRAQSDITTPTTKGYFNLADWTRIYGNAKLVNAYVEVILDSPIVFNEVAPAPTVTSIPTATDFNYLTGNIERTRAAAYAEDTIPGAETEITTGYIAGAGHVIFDYIDVNLWESTLDVIWEFYDGPDLLVCPTLSGNLTVTTGNRAVYVDCLDMADFNVDLQGTASLHIL